MSYNPVDERPTPQDYIQDQPSDDEPDLRAPPALDVPIPMSPSVADSELLPVTTPSSSSKNSSGKGSGKNSGRTSREGTPRSGRKQLASEVTSSVPAPERVSSFSFPEVEPQLDDVHAAYTLPPLSHDEQRTFIQELKSSVENEQFDVEEYLKALDSEVAGERVTIGAMTYEQAAQQERWMQQDRLTDLVQQAEVERKRKETLLRVENQSRDTVAAQAEIDRIIIRRTSRQNREKLREYMRQIQHDFTVHETKLRADISSRNGHLLTAPEDIALVPQIALDSDDSDKDEEEVVDDLHHRVFNAVKQRKWRIEWHHTPQPIKLSMLLLRAMKSKVPRGQYVMRCTIYDKLGGNAFQWGDTHRPCCTKPVPHHGHYYNVDLWVEQNVFLSTPAPIDLRPSMVYIFQLFKLASPDCHVDKVVGWGALPVCDSRFEVAEGKFRIPLLRGDIDDYVTRYERFETLYKSDLDNWLCNFYFEIEHLSRYHVGQREYSVDLQYKANFKEMLGGDIVRPKTAASSIMSPRASTGVSFAGGDYGNRPSTSAGLFKSRSSARVLHERAESIRAQKAAVRFALPTKSLKEGVNEGVTPRSARSAQIMSLDDNGDGEMEEVEDGSDSDEEGSSRRRRVLFAGNDTDSSGSDDESEKTMGKVLPLMIPSPRKRFAWEEAASLKRQTILREKGVDFIEHEAHNTDRGPGSNPQHFEYRQRQLADPDALLEYHFTVVPATHRKSEMERGIETEAQRKMNYIRHEMVKELHPRQFRHIGYWLTILMMLACFYARQFTHGAAQSVYLSFMRVPIREYYSLPWGMIYTYRADLLDVGYEIGMICFGSLFNIAIMCLLVVVTWISQKLLGIFPDVGSRFIMCWGIGVVLDPIITFFVDALTYNWYYGDAFRLYRYFDTTEGNGVVGIFLIIFIDTLLVMVSIMVLYSYLYQLHMNGRLLDVYHRIHGGEGRFIIPKDMEVSARELRRILDDSRRWRGDEGASRRVVLLNYNLPSLTNRYPDPADPPSSEADTITHLAILNVALNGVAELHRHFVRFPDGALVEVFGNLATLTHAQRQVLQVHLAANRMTEKDFLYVYRSSVLTRKNAISEAMHMMHKFMDQGDDFRKIMRKDGNARELLDEEQRVA